ncbi:hypothetical protein HHI36_001197 [Cryptolaemus montrouzieri]|uniref:Uncharacterized protein n=1 Tax=Cryptolaemus montrouzieri TaxID=559131 RepID=A0ABD2P6W3_9CUCU
MVVIVSSCMAWKWMNNKRANSEGQEKQSSEAQPRSTRPANSPSQQMEQSFVLEPLYSEAGTSIPTYQTTTAGATALQSLNENTPERKFPNQPKSNYKSAGSLPQAVFSKKGREESKDNSQRVYDPEPHRKKIIPKNHYSRETDPAKTSVSRSSSPPSYQAYKFQFD